MPTNYTNFESPQTNPLRLSPDGLWLFAANTADNRVSVFALANPSAPMLNAEIPVDIEPVSVWPVSSNEVWLVNHVYGQRESGWGVPRCGHRQPGFPRPPGSGQPPRGKTHTGFPNPAEKNGNKRLPSANSGIISP